MPCTRTIAILGSTGSIGRSTLEVVRYSAGNVRVAALTAHSNVGQLVEQAKEFKPRWIVATDPEQAKKIDRDSLPRETELLLGAEGVDRVVRAAEVEVVVAAVVGSA